MQTTLIESICRQVAKRLRLPCTSIHVFRFALCYGDVVGNQYRACSSAATRSPLLGHGFCEHEVHRESLFASSGATEIFCVAKLVLLKTNYLLIVESDYLL